MSSFKIDYSDIPINESISKFRKSKYIGMKNLYVNESLVVGDIEISDNHIKSTNKEDKTIYIDSQTNILQSAYTDDIDVINIEKNTSFIDYTKLSRTYYTKLGGSDAEYNYKNNKCIDKDNNLYIVVESDSDVVNIFDSTNNIVPVGDLITSDEGEANSEDVVIVKYNHLGEYQWSTHVGGYYEKFYPSLVCDHEGNIFVSFGNANGGDNDVLIYDTTDNNNAVETLTDIPNDSTIIVKYNSDGVFQWVIHVDGAYDGETSVYPRISCDADGNVLLSHALYSKELKIYDRTPEEYVPVPSDFFCVIIEHSHEGEYKYTQPIYTFKTNNINNVEYTNDYNYVTIKFDNDGKLKWVNHIEMEYDPDYSPRCFVDNDLEGNVILSGNFNSNLKVYNPLNTNISRPDATISPYTGSDGGDNLFLIKYDKNGSIIWYTKSAVSEDDVSDANTITDANGNIYFSFKTDDNPVYLFDTVNKTIPGYEFSMKVGDTNRNIVIVKYNKKGVIQWYTVADGFDNKYEPCLAIDNRYIQGNENTNIYLSGGFYSDINFYNSTDITHIAYTLKYDSVNDSENAFISCFNQDGEFSWATKVATSSFTSYADTWKISISADKDGHVYLMGCYEQLLNIYDSQNNDKPVATLSKTYDDVENNNPDIFIIKYNRFGLLNTSNPKLLYIEDNSDIPDSFCKEVILTNNDNNGIVNLQILKKENYGYSVRRNVLITEAIELITKNGIWIPKIIADQFEYVNDLDVIDVNTKTSFVNYDNLQNTFYTRIGGGNDDLNPQMYLDKYDNVYMTGVYESEELGIYDFTNNTVPVGSLYLDGERSLFITKYDSAGVNQWYTRIGGYYAKSEPSVFVNGNGDVFITMQSYDDGNINIYDVNNISSPVKTLQGVDTGDANTILVKYNNKGEFQWNIRMIAINLPDTPSFTSSAVVTGDLEGNLIVCGYFNGDSIEVIDTSNDETPTKIFTRSEEGPGAYFICKFDNRGKFVWVNHIEGGLIPNNEVAPPDIFKFIRISLQTDSSGNLYLTSSFYFLVIIYNPDSTVIENVVFGGESGIGIFTIKYNSSGIYQWYNGVFTETEEIMFSGAIESGTCVDADGNLYLSFSNVYLYNYSIFDTRDETLQPAYSYENDFGHDSFVSIVKFNHNGIYQWNTFIKANENEEGADIVFSPVITCDNQYIAGQYNPNIYLHLSGYVDYYRSGFNFYSASSNGIVAYTLPSKEYWMEGGIVHSILSKFDGNGNFQWATTSAGYEEGGEGFDSSLLPTNVQVDRKGHVYVCGSYYDNDLYIWDVSSNGYEDGEIAILRNEGNFDCYLIKYNKYGLLNNNTHRNIYIEDVSNIPNAYEKSIVITENKNNGPVNCQILEPLSSGFGYKIRKSVTLTDYLDLINNNGKWIAKIQAEQIIISNEIDVIDVNTKLSVIDYGNLISASWTTKIGGDGNESQLCLSSDKDNNIYGLCSFSSGTLYCDNFKGGSYSINRYSSFSDIGIFKYDNIGNNVWVTHIGFDDTFKNSPQIYTDAEGNSYVTIVKDDEEGSGNIFVFDIRENSSIIKTINLNSNSTVVIKYDKDGLFLWNVSVEASSSNGTSDSITVVDKNGNVYLTGYIIDNIGVNILDTSEYIKDTINVDGNKGMFVVKFDKTGKYIWTIPLYGEVETGNKSSISCDNDGNIIISGTYNDTISVYNRVDTDIRYYDNITSVPNSSINLFMIRYDTNGKCLWINRLGSNNSSVNGEIYQPVTTVDSEGNYYIALQIGGQYVYIYDTRSKDDIRFEIPIPTSSTYNTFFAKYNKNGIIQWYSFISGYSSLPSLCVDNRFIQGVNVNNVYLSGSYSGDEGGNISIYNSASNGDYPYITGVLSVSNYNTFLIKYDKDGYLDWCSKVGGSNAEINNSILATSDGHVYLGGEFNTTTINVYQGWTLGMDPNSDIATTITNTVNTGTFDIFLVRYNRYGTVNNGAYRFGKEIYIENNNNIPDGTEKSIVIINNGDGSNTSYRQNICLIILGYNNPGYYSFRNIWFSEGITLISYNGLWFVKSSSNDVLPKRSIIMWGGDQSNIPQGWRLCDGGSLNGITTPDLRGRFVLPYNDGASGVNGSSVDGGNANTGTGARTSTTLSGTVGLIGGEVLHTLTVNEMPTHNHTVNDPGHNHSATTYDAGSIHNDFGSNTSYAGDGTAYTNNNSTGITINNTGGSAAHNNIPAYYVLCYIMKCF